MTKASRQLSIMLSHRPLFESTRLYFVFLRYCSGSIMTLVVDNLVFSAAFQRTGSIGWSMVWARSMALFISFFINRRAVFKFCGSAVHAIVRFVALVAVLGTISYFATSYLSSISNMKPSLAKLIVEGALFFVGFTMNKLFVFPSSAAGSQSTVDAD